MNLFKIRHQSGSYFISELYYKQTTYMNIISFTLTASADQYEQKNVTHGTLIRPERITLNRCDILFS